ncbi:MAG: RnfABCDGE type electron transport complex subunit A [Clostridiales bacterium]|nr:RnfABCDGE type electron transport complex subunit A [Clostridiales bacterium]
MAVKLASIFFTMILVDNYVLVKFLGICPFLGVSKKLDSAVGMSLAVTFVMVLATAATWPIQMFLLTPAGSEGTSRDMGYLQTIVFILIIAILVQLLENFLKKFIPALYKSLGVYLPLITTNCTILGVTILNIDNGYNFIESVVCAAGAGLGFLLAMVLFSGVRRRVEEAVTPKCFEGLPITLVSAAITSLSFMGFGGIVESIFHV